MTKDLKTNPITLNIAPCPAISDPNVAKQFMMFRSAINEPNNGLAVFLNKIEGPEDFEWSPLKSKADYILFRDNLKSWLRNAERFQKALKVEMKAENSWAQSLSHSGADYVSRLIALRRFGKAWSWEKAKEARAASEMQKAS